jgi:hypothetical protein
MTKSDRAQGDTKMSVTPIAPERSRGTDGHRAGRRRLRGALPKVRHYGTGAGNVRRSAMGAVGAGAAEAD